jgi:hypothetical protein
MLNSFQNLFEEMRAAKGRPRMKVTLPAAAPPRNGASERKQTFSKVFRWRLPDGQTDAPRSVEIVGSFTAWEKVTMTRENERGVWAVTIPDIPVNRTHHYMLLADGKPVRDENADGMAVPRGPLEEQYQLMTPRGGRVFMGYGQTK